jgi:hypothetical protein
MCSSSKQCGSHDLRRRAITLAPLRHDTWRTYCILPAAFGPRSIPQSVGKFTGERTTFRRTSDETIGFVEISYKSSITALQLIHADRSTTNINERRHDVRDPCLRTRYLEVVGGGVAATTIIFSAQKTLAHPENIFRNRFEDRINVIPVSGLHLLRIKRERVSKSALEMQYIDDLVQCMSGLMLNYILVTFRARGFSVRSSV